MRREKDLIGYRELPDDALYGVHTLRAVENFPITGQTIASYPQFIAALASVKEAAAIANRDLGILEPTLADAIIMACEEIRGGKHHAHFVVDVIQGGAGTSTNMNANEVIANRALQILGAQPGDFERLSPNTHVNMGQSTNDVYPTAIKVALILKIKSLVEAMDVLRASFARKAEEFKDILKIGRTQLQDAVPMTLGQEFSTFAVMLEEDMARLLEASKLLHEINLGATAIGTKLNTHKDYPEMARAHLSLLTGETLITAGNLVEATQDAGAFVQLSGVLKRVAVKLSKSCNDLRLLSSGPRGGFNEINLPVMQAGSSIMPGKVNPVIPEVVNQVAFEVIGNDITVTFAAEGGQLQLNAFEPIIAHSLFKSLAHMRTACLTLATRCVDGITANRDVLAGIVENSLAVVTALNPLIGYAKATEVALFAHKNNKSIKAAVIELGYLSAEAYDKGVDVRAMVGS